MTQSHLVRGVDHAAFPTFAPKETIHFYRDVLGFPVVHATCALGWGPARHPDFIHFFFDIGQGDRLAFFYYFGVEPYRDDNIPELIHRARHLAIHVGTEEDLMEYRRRLDASNWPCELQVRHETVESIYVHDPNGYLIEFARPLRAITPEDDVDANLSVEALLAVADEPAPTFARFLELKAELIAERFAGEPAGVTLV
ncbi:VOC family protein [Dactylosporangium salmoneum]|uniref:VOC domain-containing protein n=1 Tax=Dactylosporangium salmoneum TaxID=53361 RepID=A0ABP5U2Y5_9ACTN